MASFVITAVFAVGSGQVLLGKDVFAKMWGAGHQFSYCDGRTATLVVEVVAPDSNQAFELTMSRAEQVWESFCGQRLPVASMLRLRAVAPQRKAAAEVAGRVPDQVLAEAIASRAARLRAAVAALCDLQMPCPESRRPADGAVALELPSPFPLVD